MTVLSKIQDSLLRHAYKCDSPKFSVSRDQFHLHNMIKCDCGFECELPFSAALESPEAFKGFRLSLAYFNSAKFKETKAENIKKEKEEEVIRRNIEKRKNAIGSLEV